MILVHGKVFTSSSARPYVEALAIRGDRILATGTSHQIAGMAGPHTRRVDLGGRVVVPGFNDAHFHPGFDVAGRTLNLQGMEPSWDEVTRELQRVLASPPKGSFIFGETGAAVFETAEANRSSLDKLAPEDAVLLSGWTGHYHILNTAAMRKLGRGYLPHRPTEATMSWGLSFLCIPCATACADMIVMVNAWARLDQAP